MDNLFAQPTIADLLAELAQDNQNNLDNALAKINTLSEQHEALVKPKPLAKLYSNNQLVIQRLLEHVRNPHNRTLVEPGVTEVNLITALLTQINSSIDLVWALVDRLDTEQCLDSEYMQGLLSDPAFQRAFKDIRYSANSQLEEVIHELAEED